MTKTPGRVSWLVGGALLVTVAAPAQAQQEAPGAGGLEEIVVTARKREESIQDAPLSISAFTAAQIEERGVENVTEIAKYTPGLTYYASTSRASGNFSIRGVSESFQSPSASRRNARLGVMPARRPSSPP